MKITNRTANISHRVCESGAPDFHWAVAKQQGQVRLIGFEPALAVSPDLNNDTTPKAMTPTGLASQTDAKRCPSMTELRMIHRHLGNT